VRTNPTGLGQHPNATANTKALWVFDKGSANTAYDIVGGRNVTSAAAAQWTTGLVGQCVNMRTTTNGMIDGVTAAGTDSAFCLSTWTCEAWVRLDNESDTTGAILEYSNPASNEYALTISIVAGNVNASWVSGGAVVSANSTSKIRTGTWTHIAVAKIADGASFATLFYINGVLDNTPGGLGNASAAPAGVWRVGTGSTGDFPGEICSVHATADTLTLEQVRENWRRGMLWQNESQTGHGNTYLDVYVTPFGAVTSVLLNQYGIAGINGAFWNFLEGVTIVESVDNQCDTATLALKREVFDLSLAPTMDGSAINQTPAAGITHPGPDSRTSQDLLAVGGTVTIWAKRVPEQLNDPNQTAIATGTQIFSGSIDSVNWASSTISVECIDDGSTLVDTYFELEADYNSPNGSSTAEAGMQALINAGISVAPPALYTPVSPGWTIGPWTQRRESVMQSIQTLADQIGWLVKYKYDPISRLYRLTLHDPQRAQTRFDGVITPKDYTQVSRIAQALTNVRNVVRVSFLDTNGGANGVDREGNVRGAPAKQEASDAASIALYGRRFMEIAESATSNIDSNAEALEMASAILADLKTPDVNIDLDLPYWEIEIGDRLLFEENGRTWDTPQTMCVVSKTISFQGGSVRTSLQMKAAPASGVQKHLVKEAGPGRSLPPTIDPARAGVDFGRRGFYAPVQGMMEAAQALQNPPSLAGVQNSGFLTHPAGNYGAPTAWQVSGTWGSTGDAFWSSTSETGDRSLAILTVGTEATSWWMPVASGKHYRTSCHWQASDLADTLDMVVDLYDASRTLTGTVSVFSATPLVVNTWQCDGAVIPTGSSDKWARVRLNKKVGPTILVDRVGVDMMSAHASVYNGAAAAFGAGTTQIQWTDEAFDYDQFYSPASGQFVATEPGFYKFDVFVTATVGTPSTLTFIGLTMKVGGSGVYSAQYLPKTGVTTGELWFHSPPTLLARGDVVTFDFIFPVAVSVTATTASGYRLNPSER